MYGMKQVASMGILFNAFNFIYCTTEGYGTAASTRVSNGAEDTLGVTITTLLYIRSNLSHIHKSYY